MYHKNMELYARRRIIYKVILRANREKIND